MSESIRFWLNFREDGPWAWYWHVLRSGCWRGHDWQEEDETEDVGGAVYCTGTFLQCARCGQWGGWQT